VNCCYKSTSISTGRSGRSIRKTDALQGVADDGGHWTDMQRRHGLAIVDGGLVAGLTMWVRCRPYVHTDLAYVELHWCRSSGPAPGHADDGDTISEEHVGRVRQAASVAR
jgi:hypothetical protein